VQLIRFPISLEYTKTVVLGKYFQQYSGKAINVTKQDYDFSSLVIYVSVLLYFCAFIFLMIYISVLTSSEARTGQSPGPAVNEQLWNWRHWSAEGYCVDSSTL